MKKKQIILSFIASFLLVVGMAFAVSTNVQAKSSTEGVTTSKPYKVNKKKKEFFFLYCAIVFWGFERRSVPF